MARQFFVRCDGCSQTSEVGAKEELPMDWKLRVIDLDGGARAGRFELCPTCSRRLDQVVDPTTWPRCQPETAP